MAVHLIPLFERLGQARGTAVLLAALIGPMQVAGRVGEMAFAQHTAPQTTGKLTFALLPAALASRRELLEEAHRPYLAQSRQASGAGPTTSSLLELDMKRSLPGNGLGIACVAAGASKVRIVTTRAAGERAEKWVVEMETVAAKA